MRALDLRLEQSGLKAITTAALVSYRPWKRRLTVSYAGHPPGWIFRAGGDGKGRRWERLVITEAAPAGPADLPLGTGFGPSYSRTQVQAIPGDRLLLVTDGVLEAPSPDGTEFGDAGVEGVLTGRRAARPHRRGSDGARRRQLLRGRDHPAAARAAALAGREEPALAVGIQMTAQSRF
jgi:serine phosphatase RsbU (regulator of sigma subunit)